MPGDDIVREPMATWTHAITIDAPPERVWPWLAQMGSGRAGWYSWDIVDNGGRPSARATLPAFQHIAPGDVLPSLPGAKTSFVVAKVLPPNDLVLIVPGTDDSVITSWEHLLEPLEGHRTRMIVRGRVAAGWKEMARGAESVGPKPVFIERAYRLLGRLPQPVLVAVAGLGHRFMEARHMRGIKSRAEQVRSTS